MQVSKLLAIAQQSHILDWLAVVVLTLIRHVLRNVLVPHYRMFRLNDPRIQFPMANPETVSGTALMIYFLVVPLGTIVLWAMVFRPRLAKSHLVILGLFCSVATASFIIATIKNAVGRPRPDLLSRCVPKTGTDLTALVTVGVCTQKSAEILQEGFRSFPSGHSGSAFSGLAYTSFFLASQFKLFGRPQVESMSTATTTSSTWHPPALFLGLIAFMPILGSSMIAISRLQDYRHDYADVMVGSLIGLVVAYVSWRRFFPGLSDPECAEPYTNNNSHVLLSSQVQSASESSRGGYSSLGAASNTAVKAVDDIEMGPISSPSSSSHRRRLSLTAQEDQ